MLWFVRALVPILTCVCYVAMAVAQTAPVPPFYYGYVPTAGQWNNYFQQKQDVLGFTPFPATGGTLTGPLTTFPSSAFSAGFSLPPGVAPTSPVNGDMWMTSAGLFAQIAGLTQGPFSTLPNLLPVQTVAGASKAFGASDLYWETRRSNSGSAMTDTLPPLLTIGGLVNGTRVQINNVDATATDTLSPGTGTSISGSGVVGPGRSSQWVFDAPAATWRPTMNSLTALLGPNNLSDLASSSAARSNLGLAAIAASGNASDLTTGAPAITLTAPSSPGANSWTGSGCNYGTALPAHVVPWTDQNWCLHQYNASILGDEPSAFSTFQLAGTVSHV